MLTAVNPAGYDDGLENEAAIASAIASISPPCPFLSWIYAWRRAPGSPYATVEMISSYLLLQ